MKIVLSGIETNNKGAELMLYAILQEIENKYPNAEIYLPVFAVKQGLQYIQTNLNIKEKPYAKYIRILKKIKFYGILHRLNIPIYSIYDSRPIKNADYFIDASGFSFTDQWNHSKFTVDFWQYQLKKYSKQGTKIIFLPQAFGPANLPNTKKLFALLNLYANLIIPRETTSLNYLLTNNADKNKIKMFTDFTSLIKGTIPSKYEHLKNGVCIIPNMRMIDKNAISFSDYVNLLSSIIECVEKKGHLVYLLNHEGIQDEQLAYKCREKLQKRIEVISGINALEVKGLIASSYLCISSRFHGVASALNSAVPCLATSWSHKYEELFKDYNMSDCVLDLKNINACLNKVDEFLDRKKNKEIKQILSKRIPEIQNETKEMWKCIWNI